MKEIAKEPENRFDTWILKTWKVLPTNQDYLNLTDEQKTWLWEDYLLDNPDIAKKLDKNYDEEFEEEWEKMDKENPDSQEFEEENYDIDISDKFDKFIKETNMDDIQRSPESQTILAQLRKREQEKKQEEQYNEKRLTSQDWEEIDEDDDWEEVDE